LPEPRLTRPSTPRTAHIRLIHDKSGYRHSPRPPRGGARPSGVIMGAALPANSNLTTTIAGRRGWTVLTPGPAHDTRGIDAGAGRNRSEKADQLGDHGKVAVRTAAFP